MSVAGYESGRVGEAIATIYRSEGLRGLVKGAWVKSLRVGIGTGVGVVAYEKVVRAMRTLPARPWDDEEELEGAARGEKAGTTGGASSSHDARNGDVDDERG